MPSLADLTLAQLRAATKAQLIAAIDARLNNMSKRQIIALIWSVVAPDDIVDADPPVVVDGKHGPLSSLQVFRDALGAKTGSQRVTWSYYPAGPVDTIVQEELDAADKVTKTRQVKHFPDGAQPVTTVTAAPGVGPPP